ncbi:CLD10 protein, partial [Atractosteus spatula]|nr:CLD10 protein [Atractosteus spatula]
KIMRKRLAQIFGFLLSSTGWIFVACTMAMDYWKVADIGGKGGSNIISIAWYWSNLWKDCFIDSTAVVNCRDFAVLWGVEKYIQGVRGLLMIGLSLGFFGAILAFLGMECTFIGGNDKTKDKVLFIAAVFHFLGGLSNCAGYCLYINQIATDTFNPTVTGLHFIPGTPIFLGLVGAFLIMGGGILYAVSILKDIFPKSSTYVYSAMSYVHPKSRNRTIHGKYSNGSRRSRESEGSKISTISKGSVSRTNIGVTSDRDAFV